MRPTNVAILTLMVLRGRHRLAKAGVIGLVLGLLFALSSGKTYSAHASFAPQNSGAGGGVLRSLAAQAGFAIGGDQASQSPEFYAQLLRSPEILRPVVEARYAVGPSRDSIGLPDLLGVEGVDSTLVIEQTLVMLRGMVSATSDGRTGTVSLSFSSTEPEVSYQVVAHILSSLNNFNLRSRRSSAAAEREFLEGRLGEAQVDLATAERALREFLQQNRVIGNSPALTFERERLQREIDQRVAVVNSLTQAYENARMEEVRATPVITLLELPSVPVLPDARHRVLKALTGLTVGLLFGLLFVFISPVALSDVEVDQIQEITASEWRGTRRDLLHPLRLLTGSKGQFSSEVKIDGPSLGPKAAD